MCAVDEGFAQVKLAAIAKVFRDRVKGRLDDSAFGPLLKSSVTGLIRRISSRQVGPRSARTQDPEHPVQYGAWINPRATAAFSRRRKLVLRKVRCDRRPLIVGDIHL